MLIQLTKTTGETIGINTDTIWKVINNYEGGSTVKVGAKSYELSTSYADVLALGGGAFKEYDFIVGGETIAFALNPSAIARVSRDRSKVYFHLTTGDKLQVDSTFNEVFSGGGSDVVTVTSDFVANGPSGTVYVAVDSEAWVATIIDSPIGTEYTFFATSSGIILNLFGIGGDEEINHTIRFWESVSEESRDVSSVILPNIGTSITIKKISPTVWAGIAVNGAVEFVP